MTAAVSIDDAQEKLADLIHGLHPGDEVTIMENGAPVARLVPAAAQQPRRLGSLRGTVLHVADDFDAPLDDFAEYIG